SGDQNGYEAPSVPASGCAVVTLRFRTHSWLLPVVPATNASLRPSGETAKLAKLVSGGGNTDARTAAGRAATGHNQTTAPMRATSSTTAAIQPRRSRRAVGGAGAAAGWSAAHCSSN